MKRLLDVVGAAVVLVVLAPLLGAVAVLVACHLGRPVLYRQPRPGLHGRTFTIVKFRSMLHVDPASGVVDDADRLTPFGAWLRSTSLDELPSLWNVLRGEMSFVGPRPSLCRYLELYDAEQARRHDVRPGLTGLAQVRGRNALPWPERLRSDVEYVDTQTLGLDARILARTVGVVLRREGITTPGHATSDTFTGSRRPA
ncbi:sugar transferase [Curtobacterium sp. RRHDQ66]|uniref:sugar transferase n=1 Tax=Curtobacterium guangdongense TaxID=3413380 RepID=UPI003BF3FA14